jgi:hypothetical protein
VKGNNVESSPHEVIVEAAAHVDDHIQNPVMNSISGSESSTYAGYSGGKDHVVSNLQEQGVTNIFLYQCKFCTDHRGDG